MRRGNPFEDIERMLERMSEQFEDVSRGDLGFQSRLTVDVEDRPEEYVVTADLPGFGKDDIEVELAEQTLRIAAEQESEAESEEPGRYVRRERSRESMSRAVSLPEAVEEEGVEARFKNGVLTVTLPKAYGSEDTHQIDIE
ncbi:Molecular chaperone (HSP20 family) [Halanaeroarchaeum sp. HSR-CO]|uniref:Hsp20/alpha crystallin family protein n=1 Tax=Halanaeroarchaeum sp. HSR-CO TaxID=2866382 RepID=UPI00217CF313|nr:Hsp20/alpha crystallin family protein [Halanaeroarchaeum sp. HSR-CO]UWG48953.1 Molecular chaperone (HSP20 family) [Halanaeroarchaeum sp. HSR-CO]